MRLTLKSNDASGWPVTGTTKTSGSIPICYDGSTEILLPADGRLNCDADPGFGKTNTTRSVYMVTALAVTQSGARRMAQMEMAFLPPLVTNGAVVSNDDVVLNGALLVNGYDNCSCACKTETIKGNKVMTCVDRAGHTCDNTKYGIFASGTVEDPSGAQEGVFAGLDPPYTGKQKFPYNIPSLIETYKN